MTVFDTDALYLRRCFDVAQRGVGQASPNPSVGAVVVADRRIIGEGHTQPYGQSHAEVMAVAAVKPADRPLLAVATLYVTLEPCFHYGKTPPCVDLVLREKIPRVVIALKDPFEAVAGKSIEKMRAAGIEVVVYPLAEGWPHWPTDAFLNHLGMGLKPFLNRVAQNRPYIILKWAQTADGYIGHTDRRLLISNAVSQRLVHKWRAEADAIMVGTETAQRDDPKLDNRLFFGKSPLRVVIDRYNRLLPSLHLFTDGQATQLYTLQETHTPSVNPVTSVVLDENSPILPQILSDLMHKKIGILFVEGGAQLLQAFIDADLWDEARILVAKDFFLAQNSDILRGGIAAPILPTIAPKSTHQILDNQLLTYENNAKMAISEQKMP